jgi:hypothetical protein
MPLPGDDPFCIGEVIYFDASTGPEPWTYIHLFSNEEDEIIAIYSEKVHQIAPKYYERLAWTEERNEVILPETTYTFSELEVGSGFIGKAIERALFLKEGYNYAVDWNGQEYICTCKAVRIWGIPALALGNLEEFGFEQTSEPFRIADISVIGRTQFKVEEEGTCTVRIRSLGKIHQIDKKYLPDGGVGYTEGGERVAYIALDEGWKNIIHRTSYLEIGKRYTIQTDRHTYEGVCKGAYEDTVRYLGNGSRYDGVMPDTGEYYIISEEYFPDGVVSLFIESYENDEDEVGDKYVDIYETKIVHQIEEKYIPDNIPKIESAQAGQTLVVKAVDENDKPTEWELINLEDKIRENAVLYTEQMLTEEQKAQARENIGAETSVPLVLDLADYGIDYTMPLLSGGGHIIFEDVGTFWDDVNAVKPGQALLLTSNFGDITVIPSPATLYFDNEGGLGVRYITSILTFYYNGELLTASSNIMHDPSGTKLSVVMIDTDAVLYTEQTLTDEQKEQARANIGAITADDAVNVTFQKLGIGEEYKLAEILPEGEYDFVGGGYQVQSYTQPFSVGDKIMTVIDGVKYIDVVKEVPNALAAGNTAAVNDPNFTTDPPYVISAFKSSVGIWVYGIALLTEVDIEAEEPKTTQHTVAIYKIEETTIIPIDPKYLPEGGVGYMKKEVYTFDGDPSEKVTVDNGVYLRVRITPNTPDLNNLIKGSGLNQGVPTELSKDSISIAVEDGVQMAISSALGPLVWRVTTPTDLFTESGLYVACYENTYITRLEFTETAVPIDPKFIPDKLQDVLYRKLTGVFIYNKYTMSGSICHCVETLPEIGEVVTTDMERITAYYNIQDGIVYGYIDEEVGSQTNTPVGWYTLEALLSGLGAAWGGVITDINDALDDDSLRVLLQYSISYLNENAWKPLEFIGRSGSGIEAEVFNGYSNMATGDYSHAEGQYTNATGDYSHAEGYHTNATGDYSHAEGYHTNAEGHDSHAEGISTNAKGSNSHAEGSSTNAIGASSHAEGAASHAEGYASHAEGFDTKATGYSSHAEGRYTNAKGDGSHAEGFDTKATGHSSHAEGGYTKAEGYASHAEGYYTHALSRSQHVQGEYNIPDPEYNVDDPEQRGKYVHIVGNGDAYNNRSNAHTLDWNGVGWYQGGLQIGGNAQDDGAKNVLVEGDAIPAPQTATVGQTLVVKAVDENGKPTEWELINLEDKIREIASAYVNEAILGGAW